MAGDYRVIRLRPEDMLVLRVPERLSGDAIRKTEDVLRKRLEAAGMAFADVWVIDGGAEIEVLAVEEVEDER